MATNTTLTAAEEEIIDDPIFLKCFQNHRFSINWITFSPNCRYLCSASDDNNVMLWNIDNENDDDNDADDEINENCIENKQRQTCYKFLGHKDSVTSVSMSNNFILSSSKDCTARLWRLDDLNQNNQNDNHKNCYNNNINIINDSVQYRCHKSSINCIDLKNDYQQFSTASDDQTVKLWSTTCANKLLLTINNVHKNWIRHVRYSKLNNNLIASCGDDGLICVYDIRTKNSAIKLRSSSSNKTTTSTHFLNIQWHPNCEYILSSTSSDCLLRIWDLRYEKTIQFYQLHNGTILSSDFHPNGNLLITSSTDQTSKIINIIDGKILFTLKAHNGSVNCAQYSSNGKYFATAGQDRSIILWKNNFHSVKNNDVGGENGDHNENLINNGSNDELNNNDGHLNNQINNDDIDNNNSINIFKCILQQLETITDSILQIDQRLKLLEEKFQKISKK